MHYYNNNNKDFVILNKISGGMKNVNHNFITTDAAITIQDV